MFSERKYAPHQIRRELSVAIPSIFGMSLITLPLFLLELRYARLYRDVSEYGVPYMIFSTIVFFFVTDGLVYVAHRLLHTRLLYGPIHKLHHASVVCTPFASHAFHPVDGVAQSLPYHLMPFLMPIHSVQWICLFVFVNCWTVSIHDGNHFSNSVILNTEAHHDVHHREFLYNLGQFTTLFDRIGGTYKKPYHLRDDGGASDLKTLNATKHKDE